MNGFGVVVDVQYFVVGDYFDFFVVECCVGQGQVFCGVVLEQFLQLGVIVWVVIFIVDDCDVYGSGGVGEELSYEMLCGYFCFDDEDFGWEWFDYLGCFCWWCLCCIGDVRVFVFFGGDELCFVW